MKSYNLQYYVDKLKNYEKFSLARYGDGELYCMWGAKGKNCDGSDYTPELREALLDSMKHSNDPTFIYGLQRVLPRDKTRVFREYPNIDWHDSEVLTDALIAGELYPLIEQLKKMDVCVVGNEGIKWKTAELIDWNEFYTVPSSNAFEERDGVVSTLTGMKNKVVLFSCGMAANTFIAELHGKVDGWLIDVGHIWDPFAGKMSRSYLNDITPEQLNKNLCP